MTSLTIELPDTLHKRIEKLVHDQGSTVDEFIRALLEDYFEEIEDGREAEDLRQRVASGQAQTFSHDEA